MTRATFCTLVLVSAMAGIVAAAYAQQTPDAAKAPAAAPDATAPSATAPPAATAAKKTSTVADTPDVPSADTLKKAREAGYHTRVKRGEVYYCKDVVETGTRFKTEHCLDENQLARTLIQQQAQRDQLNNYSCVGTACNGK
jgi:hypothetical protein